MRNGKTYITIRCIIQNIHDKVLLIKRSPQEVGNIGLWELPGGHIDFGEHPNTSVIREVYEETGIKIKNPILSNVSSRLTKHKEHALCLVYVTHVQEPTVKLSVEHTEHTWISPTQPIILPLTIRSSSILSDYQRELISVE